MIGFLNSQQLMKEVENLGWQGWAKADLCLIQDFFTMAWSVSYVKGSIQRFIQLIVSGGLGEEEI